MFVYCKKCGFIKNVKTSQNICMACEIPLEPVPKEFLTDTGLMFSSQSAREKFEKIIQESEEYDANVKSQREEIISQKEAMRQKEIAEQVEIYKNAKPQKVCPICHSTVISKISNVGKIVKVGAFGILGAGDIGKTWKCNTCGSKF